MEKIINKAALFWFHLDWPYNAIFTTLLSTLLINPFLSVVGRDLANNIVARRGKGGGGEGQAQPNDRKK